MCDCCGKTGPGHIHPHGHEHGEGHGHPHGHEHGHEHCSGHEHGHAPAGPKPIVTLIQPTPPHKSGE